MADVHDTLEAIITMVLDARAMPLSASCVLNRVELLEALEDLRTRLPDEITRARRILDERDAILDDARHEWTRRAAGTDIVKQAECEAERIVAAAREASLAVRSEMDTYVDGKLAAFEVFLSRTLTSVTRGRARLASPAAGTVLPAVAGITGPVDPQREPAVREPAVGEGVPASATPGTGSPPGAAGTIR